MAPPENVCIFNNFEETKDSVLLSDFKSVVQHTTCDICALIDKMADVFEVHEDSLVSVNPPKDNRGTLSIWFLAHLNRDNVMLDIFVPPGVEAPHPTIRTLDPVAYYSGSEESLRLARRWLEECMCEHEGCKHRGDAPMPTRVIDVRRDGEDPVLQETNGTTGSYATLSYCWGGEGQLKTTKDTLPRFRRAIPMSGLPRTASDAISICRHMNIPYLWIDALCIIQGDEDDWIRESSRMSDIYSSSTLTIAAARSPSSRQGIFGLQSYGSPAHQNSFLFRGVEVYARKSPVDDHLGTPLGLHMARQLSYRTKEKSWMLRHHELPLARRAWTVQERVLSRRVLYYTPDELWWECDSCWACECSGNNDRKTCDDEDTVGTLTAADDANEGSFSWLRDPGREKRMTIDVAYKRWAHIITLFSAGELTFSSDKLPALSGLAQQFQAILQDRLGVPDEYLAGMWRGNLQKELLWIVGAGGRRRGSQIRAEGIPTWSWASVNSIVSHVSEDDDLEAVFKVLDASVELGTKDLTGRVRGGELVLKSRVSHGHSLEEAPRDQGTMAYLRLRPSGSSVNFYADCPGELDAEGSYTCVAATGQERRLDRGNEASESEDSEESDVGGHVGMEWFMVLKASRKVEGVYERVGLGANWSAGGIGTGMWDGAFMETIKIV